MSFGGGWWVEEQLVSVTNTRFVFYSPTPPSPPMLLSCDTGKWNLFRKSTLVLTWLLSYLWLLNTSAPAYWLGRPLSPASSFACSSSPRATGSLTLLTNFLSYYIFIVLENCSGTHTETRTSSVHIHRLVGGPGQLTLNAIIRKFIGTKLWRWLLLLFWFPHMCVGESFIFSLGVYCEGTWPDISAQIAMVTCA